MDSNIIQLFTDSAGFEYGGVEVSFDGKWASDRQSWFTLGITRNMTFLELFPVLVALTLYNSNLQNSKLLFHIDNMSVVQIINKSTSKYDRVVNMMRKLILLTLKYGIQIKAAYIPT